MEDRYQKLVSEAECSWDYIDRLRMALKQAEDVLKYAEGERDAVTKRMIELEQEVGRLQKERDAAVADLEAAGICDFCGNWVHRDGKVVCGKKGKCEFVWRGPQKEA